MKVLHIFGGIRGFKIARWQIEKGVETHNLVFQDEKPFEIYYKNTTMRIHKNKSITLLYHWLTKNALLYNLYFLLYVPLIFVVGRTMKKTQPEIIMAYRHTGAFIAILSAKIFRIKNTKIIFDYQDPWSLEEHQNKSIIHKMLVSIFHQLERFVSTNADLVVTQGEEQSAVLQERHDIPASKMTYTWNTVDKTIFNPHKRERIALRKKHGLENSVAILYLGSVVKYYGIHLIPEALKDLAKKYSRVRFVVLGVIRDIPYWNSIKKKIQEYGLEDKFIEIYPETKGELPALIASCDVGLVTHMKGSFVCEVAIPIKLFEYMGSQLAVITSDLPHLTPFIVKENAGLAYQANNVEDLTRALQELIESPTRLETCRKNARKAVEDKFNWEVDMKRLFQEYKNMLCNQK